MAQARRIKRQPTTKAKKNSKRNWDLPWGLVLVILLCGVVIGMLINGAKTDNPRLGAGLKEILTPAAESDEADPQITALLEKEVAEKDFKFYDVLPDIDQIMPELPDSDPVRPDANLDYFLQAASFRSHSDAEKLRARLALKGFKSVTQARDGKEDGVIYYRVRLGPYADKRKAKTAKNKLQRLGVRPFVYPVKK